MAIIGALESLHRGFEKPNIRHFDIPKGSAILRSGKNGDIGIMPSLEGSE
ncbi:MAG: hypothetical protein U9Q90_05740 [Campylobacterota bacterium]|nr:hypothetical protein [Campylobacterota bacterium]